MTKCPEYKPTYWKYGDLSCTAWTVHFGQHCNHAVNAEYQLYDLENDPFEMNDLAKDENNRDLLMSMNDKCNTLADKEIGLENHVIHLPGPDWFWTA